MQIPASVFICVHPWLKKEVKSTAKTVDGSLIATPASARCMKIGRGNAKLGHSGRAILSTYELFVGASDRTTTSLSGVFPNR